MFGKHRYIYQSIFWIVYFVFAFLFFKYNDLFSNPFQLLFIGIIDICTVYLLVDFLIPRFLEKKKKVFLPLFVLVLLINTLIIFTLQNFIFNSFAPSIEDILYRQSYSLQHSTFFIILASGIKVYKLNILSANQISRLEKEKLESELEYLKLQMNPHFLFNTLNNVYIQTKVDSKTASETILKLSDLLRYQLYECSNDEVFLKSEIEYLQNYLDLQKIRFSDVDIKLEIDGNIKGIMIAPFVFISFIENAVKHGLETNDSSSYIHVKFRIVDNKIKFYVENSKNNRKLQKNSVGGIGMQNAKRRLEILYPNDYILDIKDSENCFYVKLEINIKS